MSKIRLIARLDVKGENLVKTIRFEGLRKLGNPQFFAKKYYEAGIDEILYVDIVASLYERNSLYDIVRQTTQDVFVPITVGGGLRSSEDVRSMLRAGADKVAMNTAAIKRPALIREIASTFGSQCMVLSIQAKNIRPGKWECYYDGGREHTGRDVVEWAQEGAALGAGEILLTSVDREGTTKGFDIDLVHAVAERVSIPVIACGGMGEINHLVDVVRGGHADAVAMAHVLHYGKLTVENIRAGALQANIEVRRYECAKSDDH